MNDEKLNKAIEKSFENFINKLADNPDEIFDNDKLQRKYNNLLKEKIQLQSNWNSLREWLEEQQKEPNPTISITFTRALVKINELEGKDKEC